MPDDVVVSTDRGHECRLMLVNGPAPGEVVTLRDAGEGITIGRDSTADITLDDQLVSRHHARLRHADGGWHVEDLGSRNGTRVNSQPIQTAVLNPGDVIRIGQRLLAFLGADQASANGDEHAADADAGKTGMLRIAKPDMREGKFGAVLAKSFANDDSTARFLRCVSMLCRLATDLHESPSIGHAARLTIASLRETIGAAAVRIWLAGPSGRLRKVDDREEESSGAEDSHSATSTMDDQLFANLAVHQNEAILADGLPPPSADAVAANQKSPATPPAMRGLSMAVPIPGRSRPRGAIECRHASMITLRREEECPSTPIQASYIDAGFDRDDLELVIAVAHQLGAVCENLEHRERLERSNDELRERLRERSKIVGESRSIRDLMEQVSRVAAVSSTVLIRGESGTGKELIAAALHDASPRSAGPFIAVNCAAFQESLLESELFGHEAGAFTGADRRRLGQFERAQKGTIFLDEVGELSASCQAKLLRVLEGHSFQRVGGSEPIRTDVRVISATHRDLRAMSKAGQFREDLYFRLRVIELQAPPLRERGEDVTLLATTFLDRIRRELGRGPRRFSPEAMAALSAYPWPGNVRELKNAVERGVVLAMGDEISVEDLGLPSTLTGERPMPTLVSLAEAERRHIEFVLRSVGGNKTQACKILQIGRATLYSKLGEAEPK